MTQNFVYGSQANTLAFRLAQGRLTLTSGTPVTTSDVTAATTLYYTPYQGNQISLYSGSTWQTITFTEVSIAVPASTSQMYDVWGYLSAGALVLELLAWTNDTTRATAITTQDGIYVKSGDATRRYLGSFRTTTVSGQTEDSKTKRYVWNYYNRVERPLIRVETTANWTYSTATWRQANNSTSNQVDVVVGVLEDRLYICLISEVGNNTATSRPASNGIGIDSTTVVSATQWSSIPPTSVCFPTGVATYNDFPTTVGRHYYTWMEVGAGTDTQTWSGVGSGTQNSKYGMSGYIRG